MWELALMRPYLLSLGAGLLVGIVYSLINVRSPAPPVIALVGLLGILAGEQIVPLAKRLLSDQPVTTGWLKKECAPHVLGTLPVGKSKEKDQA
jgi:XapX domain-containing protein